MQSSRNDSAEEPPLSTIPDDVAALYLWANLPDATYRDFSASRRKLRARRGESPAIPNVAAEPAPPPVTPRPAQAPALHIVPEEQEPARPIELDSVTFIDPELAHESPQAPGSHAFLYAENPLFSRDEPQIHYFSALEEIEYPASSESDYALESPIQDHPVVPPPSQAGRAPQAFASRWPPLSAPRHSVDEQPLSHLPTTPILAVFAPTAGAGKTVLVATLGRALSALGESVALAETSPGSPLPGHFALAGLEPGAVHVVIPATGSPISLVTYDVDAVAQKPEQQTLFAQSLLKLGATNNRLLLDLTERAGGFLRHLVHPNLTVLIPVVPTMSSVISLQAVERFFRMLAGLDAEPIEPYYLVVQFDESLPIHNDVRDFLARRVGKRLIPHVIHSSPTVAQAFAQGMTVLDDAPDSPIAADYKALADWLRTLSPPAAPVSPPSPRHVSRWKAS